MPDKNLKQTGNPKKEADTKTPVVPNIAVSTSFSKQQYLYAYGSPAEIQHFIRTQAHEDESKKLPEILKKWQSVQQKVNTTLQNEAGLADNISIQAIPSEHNSLIKSIAENQIFQKTFSSFETVFAIVEIDKLIVKQRTINEDFVKKLQKSYPAKPTFNELIDICLSPNRDMEPIQHLELPAQTPVHVFSSPNIDLRFLGSAIKKLTPDDLQYAQGGLPAAAIITFVGYGGATVNAYQAGKRLILNNGMHRVYTLRSMGVTYIPIAIQKVDPSSPIVSDLFGNASQYFCAHPRPTLMKDFFEADFTLTVNIPRLIQTVTIGVNANIHGVPA